ncbi:hypothetical protein AB0758_46505 [Tolypothrix bouteillei VB521301_2]|uniref:hypothetical protein n=1 Tax=Tolypothrix bouteillei TaxID=1246981 RepID=UPI0038B47CA9
MKKLRNAYLQNKPVDFFTAAVGEGYFTQVLISKLDVYQRAGYLNQFDFICEVIESPELKQPAGNESQLKDVDEELKNEATTSINDVQNSSTKVSEIKDLWNSNPNFANPTTKLNSLLDDFSQIFGEGKNIIEKVQNIFLE